MDIPEKELALLRKRFNEFNPELFERIELYEKEGTIKCSLGSHYYDYIHFSEVLKIGFQSTNLHYLFELLIYIHFFEHICLLDQQLTDHIKEGKFDRDSYLKASEKNAEIIISLEPIRHWCKEALSAMGVKEDLFDSEESLLDILKVLQSAKGNKLHHYGDNDFIVSKIPLGNGNSTVFDENTRINRNIFYSNSPEQIIQFAVKAEKGIYVIANVPYGKKAETAFYILFRQDDYAYLVETCKHSYRDQIYRGKSNGTPGDDAWLDKKYEKILLPVGLVLDFFSKENESTEIINKKHLDFIPIGKFDDCSPYTIIWLHGFIDLCTGCFKNPKFFKDISTAVSPEFVLSVLPEEISQLPAIYQGNLPTINEAVTAWSPEEVEVDTPKTYLETMIPKTSLENIALPKGLLTSYEQIRRGAVFEKRKVAANLLAESLKKDFLDNYKKVHGEIKDFVLSRDKCKYISKALQNDSYACTSYVQFHACADYPDGHSRVEKVPILFGWDIKNALRRSLISPVRQNYTPYYHHDEVKLSDQKIYGTQHFCDYCNSAKVLFRFALSFSDYSQFRDFYDVSEKEEAILPEQFKKYLNQSLTEYTGNSILNDVDPVSLIRNPWWMDSIQDWSEEGYARSQNNHPVFVVSFCTCGRCLKKLAPEIYARKDILEK